MRTKTMKALRKKYRWNNIDLKLQRYIENYLGRPLLTLIQDYNGKRITNEEFEKRRDNLPFNKKTMMTAIGLDFDNRKHYDKVVQYLTKNRKLLTESMEIYTNSDEYKKKKADGTTDEDMFYAFMVYAMSHVVYPLYADVSNNNKLKLLELNDYIRLVERGRDSVVTRATNLVKQIHEVEKMDIPVLATVKKKELGEGRDLFLPEKKEE